MRHRAAVCAVLALFVVAVAVSVADEADGSEGTSSAQTVRQPEPGTEAKPARTGSPVAPATTDKEPDAVPPPPDLSTTAPRSEPEASTPEGYVSTPSEPGEGDWSEGQEGPPGRRGRGGSGQRGGWQPPPQPPSQPHPPRGRWQPPPHPPHGRRGQWRRDRYRHFGTWHFLVFGGPLVWCPPRSASVVRLPRRHGVYVRQTGDDDIGRAFARSVRKRLREQGLKVVYTDSDAALELYMVSMEEDPEDPGWGSIVSVSYVRYPGHRFITAQMLDIGDEQVDELADLVVDYVDELVDQYCW